VVKGLQDCASCKSISYCGKEHQTEHFKDGHKLVCPGKAKPLPFAACVEGATQYYNAKMWASALPYYSALLVSVQLSDYLRSFLPAISTQKKFRYLN
jgi:MYND finger